MRGGELFAVLQKGEEIITRRDPRHRYNFNRFDYGSMMSWVNKLPRYHGGGIAGGGSGSQGGGPGFTLNVINQTSNDFDVVDNGSEFDGEGWVRSVILRDVRRNGGVTKALRRAVR